MVEPNNTWELVDAILSIYSSDNLRKKISTNGKTRIANSFDISISAKKWALLLRAGV